MYLRNGWDLPQRHLHLCFPPQSDGWCVWGCCWSLVNKFHSASGITFCPLLVVPYKLSLRFLYNSQMAGVSLNRFTFQFSPCQVNWQWMKCDARVSFGPLLHCTASDFCDNAVHLCWAMWLLRFASYIHIRTRIRVCADPVCPATPLHSASPRFIHTVDCLPSTPTTPRSWHIWPLSFLSHRVCTLILSYNFGIVSATA